MQKILSSIFIASFFCFGLFSCNNSDKKNQNIHDNAQATPADTLQTNNSQNNFYRVMAGIDNINRVSDSALLNEYNDQWSQLNKRLLDPIRQWKKVSLSAECMQTKTLFYPFSGPDFLIPNIFFPNVEKMVMFGLETPGIDIANSGNEYATSLIPQMRVSLRDLFDKSYFITKNISLPNLIFVEESQDWEEFWLMGLCQNHIMSNSTFSWWATFLNKNKNKKYESNNFNFKRLSRKTK